MFGLQASVREGSDGGFAAEGADVVLGLGELHGELAEVVFGGRELAGGSVGVSEGAQAKRVELVGAGVLGCGARVPGVACMLICDLHAVTGRLEFWVSLAGGLLGVPVDRLMERTAPVERHPGGQLIGVEQRVDRQAGDLGEDGLPGPGPAGEVLAGRIDLRPTAPEASGTHSDGFGSPGRVRIGPVPAVQQIAGQAAGRGGDGGLGLPEPATGVLGVHPCLLFGAAQLRDLWVALGTERDDPGQFVANRRQFGDVSGEVGLQGPRRPQVDQHSLQRPPGRVRRSLRSGQTGGVGGSEVGPVAGEGADPLGAGVRDAAGDQVRDVALAAAGHPDVRAGGAGVLAHEQVRRGDGVALGAVDGGRIGQLQMLLDIAGG